MTGRTKYSDEAFAEVIRLISEGVTFGKRPAAARTGRVGVPFTTASKATPRWPVNMRSR